MTINRLKIARTTLIHSYLYLLQETRVYNKHYNKIIEFINTTKEEH